MGFVRRVSVARFKINYRFLVLWQMIDAGEWSIRRLSGDQEQSSLSRPQKRSLKRVDKSSR
ncbi:MAG: hypothetical protein ACJA2O_003019 [Candidatus Azotimanducaceae bacterium]|jgi:hypothetical protein